jgi:hypothetical protein
MICRASTRQAAFQGSICPSNLALLSIAPTSPGAVSIFETKRYRAQRSTSDVNGIDPQIHNGTPKGVMSGLRNIFSHDGDVTTVPEMLLCLEAVKPRLPELRRNSGSRSLFETAVFQDLVFAALAESQNLIARRTQRLIRT